MRWRYIKIHSPLPSRPHTFLHRVNTTGVKIRPLLKKNYHFYLLLTIFAKHSIVDVWQGFEYIPGSEYAVVLNMPVFWIYQGFEYARVTHGFKYVLNNSWICLIMPEYVWICLNSWNAWRLLPIQPGTNHEKLIRLSKNVFLRWFLFLICCNCPKTCSKWIS